MICRVFLFYLNPLEVQSVVQQLTNFNSTCCANTFEVDLSRSQAKTIIKIGLLTENKNIIKATCYLESTRG
jgi:hypothetical protein